jgi:hypothetical protein
MTDVELGVSLGLLVVACAGLALAIGGFVLWYGDRYGDPERATIRAEVRRRLRAIRERVREQELVDYMPAHELEGDDFTVESYPAIEETPGPRPEEV